MKTRVSDLAAIAFAVTGFTFWVLGDSCIKWIGTALPPMEISAFMGLFMALALALQATMRGNLAMLRPRSYLRQGVRSFFDLANNVCVILALRHLSLTIFYILIFLSPLLVALLSSQLLQERIGKTKLVALLIGFCGVVIAVAPWSSERRVDLVGFLCCMVCVTCFSINMVWSRVLTRTEPPESLAFFAGIVTTIIGLATTNIHFRPLSLPLLLLLISIGIFCAAGNACFYFAVKHTSASNVSQYHYTQLLSGAIVTYLIWRELPGPWMILGGTLILGSGALIAYNAQQAQRSNPQ